LAALNYCREVGAKCIFTSSSAVYDAATSGDQLTEEGPIKPTLPYGISKWIAENVCRHQNVPVVILRLFNVYGPGQHHAFLVPYIIDCLQHHRPLTLRMPQARRDFIYVQDVVDALIKAAYWSGPTCSVFNIGSGQATYIIDFIHLAEQIVGHIANEIKTTRLNEGEVSIAIADVKRAAQDLKWVPRYDVCAGLRALVDSERQN
jgi:GDP-4-dehydro-6-deoxy-D-mannose reductase